MDHEEAIFLKLELLGFQLHLLKVPDFNETISATQSQKLCLAICRVAKTSTLNLELTFKGVVGDYLLHVAKLWLMDLG